MPDLLPALNPISTLGTHPALPNAPLVVVALCAEWCGTCRDFRPVLQRLAEARREIVFAWADIEEDAELVGDLDVDSFPTLAAFRTGVPIHFGASLPQEGVVARTIDTLAARPALAAAELPVALHALARWIGDGSDR